MGARGGHRRAARRLIDGAIDERLAHGADGCPCDASAGAQCVLRSVAGAAADCANRPTDPERSVWAGARCAASHAIAARGIWLVSLAANGQPVCTRGDSWHVSVAGRRLQFAALSEPTRAEPAVYWVNLSATALQHGRQRYALSIALIETVARDSPSAQSLHYAPAPPYVSWSLVAWLRHSRCSWGHMVRGAELMVDGPASSAAEWRAAAARQPACDTLPAASSMAYVALDDAATCDGGEACIGNAAARLFNTSNLARLRQRSRKGYAGHALRPLGCRLRLYDEADVARCLAPGRSILSVGSDVAVALQQGFGRINETLVAWTRRIPGDPSEQRKLFRLRTPHKDDWAYQFERTGGFNGRAPDVLPGVARFGGGSFGTMFLQHPPHYGLANLLDPEGVARTNPGRVGFKRAQQCTRPSSGRAANRPPFACFASPSLGRCEFVTSPSARARDRTPSRPVLARLCLRGCACTASVCTLARASTDLASYCPHAREQMSATCAAMTW